MRNEERMRLAGWRASLEIMHRRRNDFKLTEGIGVEQN